ncbi:hypothetical protein Poli38472_001572 [Pythium oligandrum]|uniref:Cns1/TTC4 wheel domain-containing protein n=1 Tax=Pythium oligandrum TaxID=41045 RepID=A0A8K1CVK3_PYTOL|nr:hypothetical protein Poli38472_001572 [Pythium oligandrum]|eukprot:TMW69416.1 hypothetical protein Poli38472_001572 [Pythium oligandrum]
MVDFEIDESKRWAPEERQKYIDELPEMTLFDDHIVEGDVMVDAIQALIEEGETAESLALHWKNKGNELFQSAKKHKPYYQNALQYYSDALAYALKALALPDEEKDTSFDMDELTSQIYGNRAAVHLELKNYGSCRSDAAKAIKHNKENVKAYFRGAKASRMLRKPEDTLRYCAEGLKYDPENKLLLKMQKEGEELKEQVRIENEKKEFERKKRRAYTEKYRQLCEVRQVKVGRALIDDERVKQYEGKADLDSESGQLCWPVLMLYDEYGTSDFIQVFAENDAFIEHLANMFPEDGPFCEWDAKHEYVASRLVVYAAAEIVLPFESTEEWHVALSGEPESDAAETKRLRREELHDVKARQWIEISPFCTLHQLLSHDKYVVPGIPVINVFVRDSKPLKDFLTKIEHRVLQLSHEQH